MQPVKAATTGRITVNPQVQEALAQLEKAQDTKCDATLSITIYWNQAQVLFGLKRPQYVEKALKLLINFLLLSPTTTFSSAQITSFLYNSRLALARLLCIYQELDESRSVYLDAIDGKWKLEKGELINIAQNLCKLSIPSLINACDNLATKYLTRERNRTRPAPVISDINNSITTILNEAGSLFAQEDNIYNSIPSEHIAIVLYATCSLVCQYDKVDGCTPNDFYFMMNQVYESLDSLAHHMIEINLLDKSNIWNVFNAMLLSIEIDDLVRANNIYKHLKQDDAYLYPDVKLLCDLCDNTVLGKPYRGLKQKMNKRDTKLDACYVINLEMNDEAAQVEFVEDGKMHLKKKEERANKEQHVEELFFKMQQFTCTLTKQFQEDIITAINNRSVGRLEEYEDLVPNLVDTHREVASQVTEVNHRIMG
ncbi:hypothetical protein HPULCUR_006592 [Helicostylum pulchrum]|uniref:Uncharacterized protein n=1 Tax=Helicostylum pulchrum TaxID=562976 RepID=A0ABP9Y2D0_9FUNG